jgi:hypothetical protein
VGLYLCVFISPNDDQEIDGVEVGSYDDFFSFRTLIGDRLEGGRWGSRFPLLMSHSDSDGEWSPRHAIQLAVELKTIEAELAALPPIGFPEGSWQAGVAKTTGVAPGSLAECFIDLDGEPLLERLLALTQIAADRNCPISFQ